MSVLSGSQRAARSDSVKDHIDETVQRILVGRIHILLLTSGDDGADGEAAVTEDSPDAGESSALHLEVGDPVSLVLKVHNLAIEIGVKWL